MWTNDRIRKIFSNTIGYYCVFLFFSVTSYIVYIFYSKIAPSIIESEAYGKFLFHFIFGNWIAINIYFNYTMAWLTSPGLSKNYHNLSAKYPICKKCSFSKPPRTHHCSWRNQCILRYDHHCPWLNNCVGFYNHRYFYQFCCFMSMGCLYAGLFGYREYQISLFDMQVFQHIDSFFMAGTILETMGIPGFITYYIFIIALTTGFVLLGLSWWHGRMIGRGETSVERLLNQNYVHQDDEQDIGLDQNRNSNLVQNWKRFLGVRNMREFIRRILLPSIHRPRGNGITMDDYEMSTNLILHKKDSDQSRQYIPNASNGRHSIPEDYLVNKYRSDSLTWQSETASNNVSSCDKHQTSLIDWKNNTYLKHI